jgi:hypothetical protein
MKVAESDRIRTSFKASFFALGLRAVFREMTRDDWVVGAQLIRIIQSMESHRLCRQGERLEKITCWLDDRCVDCCWAAVRLRDLSLR